MQVVRVIGRLGSRNCHKVNLFAILVWLQISIIKECSWCESLIFLVIVSYFISHTLSLMWVVFHIQGDKAGQPTSSA
ncbi:hypothetical protein JHK82_047911 [Glycine max]|nr:hypothetical protein JHK82_047911 [Glycine max]